MDDGNCMTRALAESGSPTNQHLGNVPRYDEIYGKCQ